MSEDSLMKSLPRSRRLRTPHCFYNVLLLVYLVRTGIRNSALQAEQIVAADEDDAQGVFSLDRIKRIH